MNPALQLAFGGMNRGLLHCASLLVPSEQRADWLREWRAELWHMRRSRRPSDRFSWRAEQAATCFCLGAFQDAFCVRRIRRQNGEVASSQHGSAAECLIWLAVVLLLSYTLSRALPGVYVESHPSHYQVNSGLVLLQSELFSDGSAPTIKGQQFLDLKASRQRGIDGLAFYRMAKETVSSGRNAKPKWRVAHASLDLFALLGGPAPLSGVSNEPAADLPAIVLSDALWKREFGGSPKVIGSVVHVGQSAARVLGILPRGSWRLPGGADAWLLQPDGEIARGTVGYVLAHLTRFGQSEMYDDRLHIDRFDPEDPDEDLWGVSFGERTRGPWTIFRFAIFLAFLALPAITSVSLGESCFSSHKPSWTKNLCRWIFMSAKIALLLSIAYFASLDLSYWNATAYSPGSEYAQLASSFFICLLGMRWVMLDQRERCPVCLRRVTHPAQVGQASRTFLAWNGTELICTSGHTLLHVPGLPTSWFGTQRWMYLDTSWKFLFAGSGVG
ncbi:MAG: hypothetical protein ACLPH3_15000 [Terracidiphilus sp.]